MQYPNPPLSFSIVANPRFSSGVILVISQHYKAFSVSKHQKTPFTHVLERIPCHNRATAEFTKRQIIAANKS